MPLTSRLSMSVTADLSSVLDLATARVPLTKVYEAALGSGVAVGQADVAWHDTRTLAPSANEDLDLAGVLAGLLGGTATFARVKGIVVAANGLPGPPAVPNVNNVVVGAAAATPWAALLSATGTVTLRPGAFFAAVAGGTDATGYVVGAGTADFLRIANAAGGTSVTFDIIIIGASA